MTDESQARSVWGSHAVALNQAIRLDIGPLRLELERRPWEWRTWMRRADGPFEARQGVHLGELRTDPLDEVEEQRFTFAETADPLRVEAALADRPIIATPEDPLCVLPGEAAVAYLTTPLWCRVSVGEPARAILDVATWRPQDTWFGPSTREGEFGYASRTTLCLDPGRIEHHPARAITPIRMVNSGSDMLEIKRLRVPIPQLTLFRADDGRLWTPTVTLHRDADELARTVLGSAAPEAAGPATRIAEARNAGAAPGVVRAFNSFTRSLWF
jgi:hypothetical protein